MARPIDFQRVLLTEADEAEGRLLAMVLDEREARVLAVFDSGCPDAVLPDGPTCSRCGGPRAPSGVGGGSWVHFPKLTAKDPNPFRWVGFAAEHALCRAITAGPAPIDAVLHDGFEYDLELRPRNTIDERWTRVEVKTRVARAGWTDPARFEWISVPTHEGRAPIKDVDVVVFCWWSADEPRRLWVLGRLLGRPEFERRATYYAEGERTPRGGPAPKGGAWILDVSALRPMPRGLLKEQP